MCIRTNVTSRLIYCLSQSWGPHEEEHFTMCRKTLRRRLVNDFILSETRLTIKVVINGVISFCVHGGLQIVRQFLKMSFKIDCLTAKPRKRCWRKDLNTSVLIRLKYLLGQPWKQMVFSTPVIWNLWWKSHISCWCQPAKLMSSMSLVRCKLWNLFPLLTPDVSISPRSPHPRYNELDGVSRLQTHLCPNRLRGLEALCEGPGTNLLPFSRAWEVGFIGPLIRTERDRAFCLQIRRRPPSLVKTWSWETQRLGLLQAQRHGRALYFQRKASVIMCWLRGSCPRQRGRDGGRKEENILTSTLGKLSDIYASPT